MKTGLVIVGALFEAALGYEVLSKRGRENPEFFTDSHGVVRPIRHGKGIHRDWGGPYSEDLVQRRAAKRARTGETAADQQVARQFDRYVEREQEKKRRAED